MRLQRDHPFDASRPFSRADARAAGIALGDVLGRGYRRVFFDVYVRSSVRVDTMLRAHAAVAVNGIGAFASHATSAELWGAVVPESNATNVSVPAGRPRSERRGVRAHRAPSRPELRRLGGMLLSSPAQSLIEMARDGVGLVDLVVAADSLLKAESLTKTALTEAAAGWTGSGSRVARRAAGLAREGVDSPMESRLRMLIVLAGLPEPEVNHRVRDEIGTVLMRFDLWYPALGLLVEYDGRQHADNDVQWRRDITRREALDELGLRIVVVLKDGIYERPGDTLDRVAAAIRARGGRARRSYKPEWTQYFPGRSPAV